MTAGADVLIFMLDLYLIGENMFLKQIHSLFLSLICFFCALLFVFSDVVAVYAQSPTAVNVSPSEELSCSAGSSVTFTINAADSDGNLLGAEWYGNPESPSAPMISIVKRVEGKAYTATIQQTIAFPDPGVYEITVTSFDSDYAYSGIVKWTLHVSPPAHANPLTYRSLYVDGFDSILGDVQQEYDLLNFLNRNEFSEIALYGLYPILKNDSGYALRSQNLRNFIRNAKEKYGIQAVKGIGCLNSDFDSIGEYNNSSSSIERFSGIVSEYEYWNPHQPEGGNIDTFVSLLSHMRSVADQQNMTVEAYLGWLGTSTDKQDEATRIAEKADIVYLHAYRADPYKTYGYIQDRLAVFSKVKNGIRIRPIFSAEWRPLEICSQPHKTGVDNMCFMGKWYEHNPMRSAENIFMDFYYSESADLPGTVTMDGYQYFAYSHLKSALQAGNVRRMSPLYYLLIGQ